MGSYTAKVKRIEMKIVENSERSKRQAEIFDIAHKIHEDVFDYTKKQLEKYSDRLVFQEMADWEVMSFILNIYVKIFCQGFIMMLNLKSTIMKEHEATPKQLLDEAVDSIYEMIKLGTRDEKKYPDGILGVDVK